jgi:hypothetical protein
MLGRGEAREVGANRGDQHFGGAPGDPRDGRAPGNGLLLSGSARCARGVQTRDGRVQVVQMGALLTRAGKTWWASRRPTTA